MIPIAAGAKIWIATGHTDMRKGMQGLALLVQEGFGRDPFAGCSASIWMGRRGNLDGESVSRRSHDCRADCRAQEFC